MTEGTHQSTKIIQMPPLDRANFPDDETYQAAVDSSENHRRYDNFHVQGEDIVGVPDDKIVEVFRALVDAANPVGMGYLDRHSRELFTTELALEYWRHLEVRTDSEGKVSKHTDYIAGRPIKLTFVLDPEMGTWSFNTRLYERDQGNASQVVRAVLEGTG